jgi:translation initiation factor IF-2
MRYMVKSGLKITRVSAMYQAVEIARKWLIENSQPVTISDMKKQFNPQVIRDANQQVYP